MNGLMWSLWNDTHEKDKHSHPTQLHALIVRYERASSLQVHHGRPEAPRSLVCICDCCLVTVGNDSHVVHMTGQNKHFALDLHPVDILSSNI